MEAFVRNFLSFVLITIFFSCENKSENRKADSIDVIKKDTTSFINQENILNPYSSIDISPIDMSYYPVNYPILKMSGSINTPPLIRLIYSRPHLQGRILFRDLLKYGQPWRLGANEATEIEFYSNVIIQGKTIPAGRYVLYCIPREKNWTIILNTNIDTWGLKIDSTKDFQRFEIPVTRNNRKLEYLTMVFEKSGTGTELIIAWSDYLARLPIEFAL